MVKLKKWFEDRANQAQGVIAQVNPLDGGRTYDTNQRGVNPGVANPNRPADNSPGFQLTNNSLTRGLSRGVDQINPLDNDRTWKNRQASDALSSVSQLQQHITNTGERGLRNASEAVANNRFAAPLVYGAGRSAAGTGEGLGGLYDLATPGKGNSRFGQGARQAGVTADQLVENGRYNKALYKGGQAATELATFAISGGPATKAVTKGSEIAAKAPLISKAVNYVDDVAKNGGKASRVIAGGAKYLARPDVASDLITDTLLSSGARANRGQKITPQSVATDAGISTAMALTMGAGGVVARKGVQKLRSSNVIRPSSLSDTEVSQLRTFRQQAGSGRLTDQAVYDNGVRAAQKAGIDYRNPSQVDDLIGAHMTYDSRKSQRPQLTPLNQAGFAQIPGANKAPGLNKSQREFINDYANMIEGMDSGNGVTIMPDGTRASSNSPFYRQTFAETGKAPTKQQWFDEARRQIESGKAAYGASEDFRTLAKASGPSTEATQVGQSSQAPQQELPNRTTSTRNTQQIDQSQPTNSPAIRDGASSDSRLYPNKAQATPIDPNSTTNSPDSKEWGSIMMQADQEAPQFNAVSTGKPNETRKLVDAIKTDDQISKAITKAQNDGKELNFYAKKDANGRSVGVESFEPGQHRIEAGFVVDRQGRVLGNHIKVDENGIQVNVGGELVNMNAVLGNPLDWKGRYELTSTISRNIDKNAPNKEVAAQTKDFIVGAKVKAESSFRQELDTEYKNLGKRIDATMDAKPKGVKDAQYTDDIFAVLNGEKTDADILARYGNEGAAPILAYKQQTRELYDSLITRINSERVKFGQAPIEPRKDYITHLQEMNGNKSFTGEVVNNIKNSFSDDGMATTRGGVPGTIAGRTENFKPTSAYNKFLQRRTGTKSLRDPFKAVQSYLEPALYNIHMTEPAVRARTVETAFRTAAQLKELSGDKVLSRTTKFLQPYANSKENSKLVSGFQEYANALAKKTNRADRIVIDASDASATALKGWQKLQKVGGQATILGNASSVLAQPLNQVIALADANPINYLKGLAAAIGGDKAIKQSNFIKARTTKAIAPIRGTSERIMDAGAIPLEAVEQASIKVVWHSQHAKAKAQGLTGAKAIKQADYNTERLVAGRGIADKPEAYRSTLSAGILQYTLEVNAQNKVFMRDLSPSQKATFLVAAAGVNTLFGAVTGYEPMPDFLGAAFDTGKDFINPEDDRSAGQKLVGGVQRGASEAVSMNPVLTAGANNFLTQDMRKGLFGSDSDLGRFEGTAAPVQVVKNAYNAGSNLVKGNTAAARNDALKLVPFGNQARKTITGLEANIRGYGVDKSGNPTFSTGKTPYQKAQNVLFGPSSTSSARTYYDNNQKPLSDKQSAQVKASSNPSSEVDAIQSNRAANRPDGQGKDAIIKAAFGTPEGKAFMQLSEEDKKGSPLYDQYKAMKKGLDDKPDLPTNLSPTSKDVLNKHNNLTDDAREKMVREKPDYEYNLKLAEYERDKPKMSKVEQVKREDSLVKDRVGSKFSKDTRELYSMDKDKIYDYAENNNLSDKDWNDLLALDKAEIDAGLRKYSKFKGGRGGSGKKGGKGKKPPLDLLLKGITPVKLGSVRKSTMKRVAPPSTPTFSVKTPRVATKKAAPKGVKVSKTNIA